MTKHIPVMLNEVIDAINPQNGKVYVDATFGNGGYTQAILDTADCKVIAIDQDPNVVARAKEIKDKYQDRFEFRAGKFGDIANLIDEPIDAVVFDIGVSSMQLDEAQRGFSYSKDAPLDMRMSCKGQSASDIVNNTAEKELADILYKYGEEKKSRQIASKICEYRQTKKIETTKELAEIIYKVIFKKPNQIDPATRSFQAIRIAVNNELGELESGLANGLEILKAGGKMVVVTFHSLEDRIVKNFFNQNLGKTTGVSRYMPAQNVEINKKLAKASKAILPTQQETDTNPRARSAKLRFAIKIEENSHE